MKLKLAFLILIVSLVGCSESTQIVASSNHWRLENIQDIGIAGVSPELIRTSDGKYLLLATTISPDRVFESSDGVNFSPSSIMLPPGSDYSVIQKADGTFLLYFAGFDMQPPNPSQMEPNDADPQPQNQPMDPSKAKKKVFVSTSSDLQNFSKPIFTGIEQETSEPAWGVPDTYFDLDGNIKMMWVEMIEGERDEVLLTATSKDGITFTRDSNVALKGGYVDPYMLQVAPEDWILLLSTTPHRLPQKLFVAYSQDGENWTVEKQPLLEEKDFNNLDPSAVEVAEDRWKVIYSNVDLNNALSGPYAYKIADLILDK